MGSDAATGAEAATGSAAEHRSGQPPRAHGSVRARHVRLDAGDVELSGLLAEPDGEPRAVVVGLPGGGMRASYFHGRAHPDLSLLTIGATLGFSVLALDRPGYGASAALEPARQTLAAQTAITWRALETFAAFHAVGAGLFLIGHSFGTMLSVSLAADERGSSLLGIDVSGVAARYRDDLWSLQLSVAGGSVAETRRQRAIAARKLFWGPEHLYPSGTFLLGVAPAVPVPVGEASDATKWPQMLPLLGPRVRVPVRWTLADHEYWWDVGETMEAEIRAAFSAAPHFELVQQRGAGHNLSLGWAARSYHLRALSFAEECIRDRATD
ncbi:alpha/beta hydrolase [Candidatus Protofrankia californiensis]|uniref:alpha/beta hydrolase n=1 Tax=Candidatus Protofrankia californiensis TaxID=1839754 RepID=UPI0013EDF818|nr:alpha/beta hydrolase [Candidatus Protofrankia californiensis]